MLRYSTQVPRAARRQLSRSVPRHNVPKPKPTVVVTPAPPAPVTPKVVVPVTPTPKKKPFSVAGFLFKTTAAVTVLYGTTLYAATKNEKVMDFVIDKQPPYYEELINFIEKGSVDDIKTSLLALQSKFTPAKDKIDELTHKGESLYQETKKKLSEQAAEKASPKGAQLPAEQLQKPVEVEPAQKAVKPLSLIAVPAGVDATVKATINSFNELIKLLESGPKNEALIKAINDTVAGLSARLDALTKNFDDELQSKLKVSQTELLSSYTKKELELTENFLHQFNQEKANLEAKLNKRLTQEIDATKEALSQAAVNAVSMVRIEQTKKFEKLIQDKINAERNGRLAGLESLVARLGDLEKFSESLESQLEANHHKSLVHHSLVKLKALLFSSAKENEPPRLLAPYINDLQKVSQQTSNEVFSLALAELSSLIGKESNQSILTTSQLLSRWELLAPELRSASLLPPNAGLLGHLASVLFSKLLLPVKGSKPDGKDIESVIGRVSQSLARGELDIAVEEAANLKGWSRELARDWVNEGTKRLETEFLISVIEAETKLI